MRRESSCWVFLLAEAPPSLSRRDGRTDGTRSSKPPRRRGTVLACSSNGSRGQWRRGFEGRTIQCSRRTDSVCLCVCALVRQYYNLASSLAPASY